MSKSWRLLVQHDGLWTVLFQFDQFETFNHMVISSNSHLCSLINLLSDRQLCRCRCSSEKGKFPIVRYCLNSRIDARVYS